MGLQRKHRNNEMLMTFSSMVGLVMVVHRACHPGSHYLHERRLRYQHDQGPGSHHRPHDDDDEDDDGHHQL